MNWDISELKIRFKYESDGKFDSFHIMPVVNGRMRGDCDDFACTALWMVAGRSMWRFWFMLLTGQARIWRCFSIQGNPHAVLWVKGLGYVDNFFMEWREETPHKLRWTRPVGVIALKMLAGKILK